MMTLKIIRFVILEGFFLITKPQFGEFYKIILKKERICLEFN